jgi:hypothetical protein
MYSFPKIDIFWGVYVVPPMQWVENIYTFASKGLDCLMQVFRIEEVFCVIAISIVVNRVSL